MDEDFAYYWGIYSIIDVLDSVVTKKGGTLHVRSGWVYVIGMVIVAITAVYMAIYRIIDPTTSPVLVSFSLFLLYISILSSSTAYYGIRVLRFKTRKERHTHVGDLGFLMLLLISSIGMSIYGYIKDFPLLTRFPLLGVFLSTVQLRY
jgi:uncharacterized membrane protein